MKWPLKDVKMVNAQNKRTKKPDNPPVSSSCRI